MSQEIFRKLRQMLMEKLDVYRELTDQEILETIDELIVNTLRESGVSLKEKVQLRQELFYSVRKLDVLQELIEDETVTEIMVNGPDSIFVERKGKLTRWPKSFTDQEKLEDVIQQIVGKCNRIVNESSPIVDARLENGARVNVVVAPVALNGPILTIRRFPDTPITMEKLLGFHVVLTAFVAHTVCIGQLLPCLETQKNVVRISIFFVGVMNIVSGYQVNSSLLVHAQKLLVYILLFRNSMILKL